MPKLQQTSTYNDFNDIDRFGQKKGVLDEITFLPSQMQQSLIAELHDEGKQQSVTAESTLPQGDPIITATSHDGFAMSF